MKVLIIGAGRVGTSMGYLLNDNNFEIIGIYNKHFNSAREAAGLIGEGVLPLRENELGEVATEADLIIITTPDDEISKVAAKVTKYNLKESVYLMHMSGLFSSEILKPEGSSGIYTFSLHPLQSIASFKEGIKLLPGSYFTLEGDTEGRRYGESLARTLNLNYGFIESKYKPLYHAAAVIASNYLVTLLNSSYSLLATADINDREIKEGILNLVQGTLDNIKEMDPESALTGPIARGDADTIRKHLYCLESFKPEYLELYRVLGKYTAGMLNNSKLSDENYVQEKLKEMLTDFQN